MTRPSPRSLIGLIIFLVGLALYVGAVAWLADFLGDMPMFLEILFYAIAGIAWIVPVRSLMKWMTKEN
ncbi:MAG: DUF2842 domain-containing protein [Sphingomonadales bacterium]|jgi:hypothetical protein